MRAGGLPLFGHHLSLAGDVLDPPRDRVDEAVTLERVRSAVSAHGLALQIHVEDKGKVTVGHDQKPTHIQIPTAVVRE